MAEESLKHDLLWLKKFVPLPYYNILLLVLRGRFNIDILYVIRNNYKFKLNSKIILKLTQSKNIHTTM